MKSINFIFVCLLFLSNGAAACEINKDIEFAINTGGAAWDPQTTVVYKDGTLEFSYFKEYEDKNFDRKVEITQKFYLNNWELGQFLKMIEDARIETLKSEYSNPVTDGLVTTAWLSTEECHKKVIIRNVNVPRIDKLKKKINSIFAPSDVQLF